MEDTVEIRSSKRQDQESMTAPIPIGVIGVGSMGRNHARVYRETPYVDLVGVTDVDSSRARSVAAEFDCEPLSRAAMFEMAEAVSIAVPTEYHYEIGMESLEHGLDVLIEKPFVNDLEHGRELADKAESRNLTLQVGHIERFNPATQVLSEIVSDLEIVGIDVQRLGPPLDRPTNDNVIKDLMVHDIDILLSILSGEIQTIAAAARDERHVTAQIRFSNGSVGVLTASRLTQQKIRQLAVTAVSCRVNVDFIDQTLEIHRRSLPEYVNVEGGIRYRHESVVERPMVKNREPLKAELGSFVDTIREGGTPLVSAEDALRTLEVADQIEKLALQSKKEEEEIAIP